MEQPSSLVPRWLAAGTQEMSTPSTTSCTVMPWCMPHGALDGGRIAEAWEIADVGSFVDQVGS